MVGALSFFRAFVGLDVGSWDRFSIITVLISSVNIHPYLARVACSAVFGFRCSRTAAILFAARSLAWFAQQGKSFRPSLSFWTMFIVVVDEASAGLENEVKGLCYGLHIMHGVLEG